MNIVPEEVVEILSNFDLSRGCQKILKIFKNVKNFKNLKIWKNFKNLQKCEKF